MREKPQDKTNENLSRKFNYLSHEYTTHLIHHKLRISDSWDELINIVNKVSNK